MPAFPDIAWRVHSYLDRQIAWLEKELRETDGLVLTTDGASVDAFLERVHRQNHALEEFAREQNGLLAEWRQGGEYVDAARDTVQEKTARIQELLAQLSKRQEQFLAVTGRVAAEVGTQLTQLRRGHGVLGKYRQDDGGAWHGVDRRA